MVLDGEDEIKQKFPPIIIIHKKATFKYITNYKFLSFFIS